jgi:integrase
MTDKNRRSPARSLARPFFNGGGRAHSRCDTFGETWTGDGFRASWGTAFNRAKLGDEDFHFHDLRGTAVTRMALSAGTVVQIAAITGHSPRDEDEIPPR